jgi:hypothetical protein
MAAHAKFRPAMGMAMTSILCRALAPAVLAAAAVLAAQTLAQAQQNPICTRLEAQLASFDRSASDPARADQIQRFEDAASNQQNEIDRQQALGRRMGCGNNSFFVLFSGEPAQCGPLNAKIQQMRANLDNIRSDLARLQGAAGPERDSQRRAILVALAQSNCGQQYRAAVASTQPRSGGLFESLFGPGTIFSPGGSGPGWSTAGESYRTICVRTCDGFYFPISFAASPSRFADDEKVCQKSCPAAEVMLFAHRNPGEDVSQAVSIGGQLYATLPNAFRYRASFDSSCSCRQPGESWAHALKNIDDNTVERGDIVVNEERSRQLSQPRVDAQGKPMPPAPRINARPDPKLAKTAAPAPSAAPDGAKPDEAPVKPDPNRPVRAVGPTFLPGR